MLHPLKESYICYAFWVPYEVYINDFFKISLFSSSSVFLMVLNAPSGVRNSKMTILQKTWNITFLSFWDFKPNFARKDHKWSSYQQSTCQGATFEERKTELEENDGILKNPLLHFIWDPKGVTYVGFFLHIKSHAKMRRSEQGHTCKFELKLYFYYYISG